MLWIEKYHPKKLTDILGQDPAIRHLSSFAASKSVHHLILSGPHGTGKSAAIECFAKVLYQENWELNTSVFQTADLFLQGKSYLEQDDRYAHLYQKNQSLITNFKYIIKWYASLRPLGLWNVRVQPAVLFSQPRTRVLSFHRSHPAAFPCSFHR